jgi:hypothetical protein
MQISRWILRSYLSEAMKLIRVIKNWKRPDLKRQSKTLNGHWGDIVFSENFLTADAVLILNCIPDKVKIKTNPENIFLWLQEPACNNQKYISANKKTTDKIIGPLGKESVKDGYSRQPVTPWHINKNYLELKKMDVPPKKTKNISCIASNKNIMIGHKKRLEFILFLEDSEINFDLFGKGFNFIEDKWEALASYRYSIAIENSSEPNYWTEKIADCFLSYTIPIYYGCTNLHQYFPSDSYIEIDITKPVEAKEKIKKALSNDYWENNFKSLCKARQLILDKYQFFPFVSEYLSENMMKNERDGKEVITLGPSCGNIFTNSIKSIFS